MERKRFIAGARCPDCEAVDKLVIYRQGDLQFRECVACGFREQMQFEGGFRELETRVNRTLAEREADTGVIRLIDTHANESRSE